MKLMSGLLVLLVSNFAFAGWSEDFALLKNIPRNYTDAGSICEEIARLDFEREYPAPQYKVEVGIEYDAGGNTIGELDLVVFDLNLNKVISVGEVKCWRDVRGGLKKAREQRARFQNTLSKHRGKVRLKSTTTDEKFPEDQFQNIQSFFAAAQKGSQKQGFDFELEYTLSELHQFRKEMLKCQADKICAQPLK